MAVPRAVKKKREEAEKLRQQLYGSDTSDEPAEPDNEPDKSQQGDQGGADAGEGHDDSQHGDHEGRETSGEDEGDQAAADDDQGHEPAQEPGDDHGADGESVETLKRKLAEATAELERERNRYSSLEGKYRAEVPRMAEELRSLREQVETLQQGGQQQDGGDEPADQGSLHDRVEALRTDLGDDIVDGIQELVKNAISQETKPLERQVSNLSRQSQQTAEERFEQRLAERVPDWQQINVDQAFIDWLQHVDPMLGKTRHEALNEAGQQLDANRVAAFFERFKEETGRGKKPGNDNSNRGGKRNPKPPVHPGRSRSSQPQPGPSYSMDDWVQLQNDKRRGKYRGREAEFRQKEREIHRALFGGSQGVG